MKEKLDFNKPAREIPTNYRNVTGRVFSIKTNRYIGFESKLERDFIYICEFDPRVEKILEQPVTINYKIDDSKTKYTPDFFILFKNGEEYLIEIKYRSDLYKDFENLKTRFQVACQYAQENDCTFKIVTDKCSLISNKDYLFNVHFLLSYDTINYEMYTLILSKINQCKTIQELLDSLTEDKYQQLEYINHVWTLVRMHIIELNLLTKINLKSKILSFETIQEKEFKQLISNICKRNIP